MSEPDPITVEFNEYTVEHTLDTVTIRQGSARGDVGVEVTFHRDDLDVLLDSLRLWPRDDA